MAVKVFCCPGFLIPSLQSGLPPASVSTVEFPKQRARHSSGNLIWRLEARERQLRKECGKFPGHRR